MEQLSLTEILMRAWVAGWHRGNCGERTDDNKRVDCPELARKHPLYRSAPGLLAACKTALGAFDALKVIGADKDLPGYNRCLRELQAAIKEAER